MRPDEDTEAPEEALKPGFRTLAVGFLMLGVTLGGLAWLGGAYVHVLIRLAVDGWGAGG